MGIGDITVLTKMFIIFRRVSKTLLEIRVPLYLPEVPQWMVLREELQGQKLLPQWLVLRSAPGPTAASGLL